MRTPARVIEQQSHLSKSFIWNLQAKYYESLGVDAWLSGAIPSRVTCNSYIARNFARLIAAYVADVGAEQVTILELGAGHGRFGFLCASHLKEMASLGSFDAAQWKYVLTDVAQRNIEFWERHEAFAPLVEEGLVDFARYESSVDRSIAMRVSGSRLGRDQRSEHLIVIANYFFDSMPMDVWQVDGGVLKLCSPVLSVGETAGVADPTNVEILEHLELGWAPDVRQAPGYEHGDWNAVVEQLRQSVGTGTFTLPTGAFEIMTEIDSWSQSGSLLLVADKGYTREAEFVDRPFPTMVRHGCFSFSLNFCALARWYARQGGAAFLPRYGHDLIASAAFASNRSPRELACLRLSYAEGTGAFSPDDYHQITRRCEETHPDFRACLGLLRLSCCEPLVLHRLRRAIRAQLASAASHELDELRPLLARTIENYYHLSDTDIPFDVGLIYQRLGDTGPAIANYRNSLRLFGESPVTLVNLAQCLLDQSRTDEAARCIDRALELEPRDEGALALKSTLETAS